MGNVLCRQYEMSLHSNKRNDCKQCISFRFPGSTMTFFHFSDYNHAPFPRKWNFLRNINDVIFFPPLGVLLLVLTDGFQQDDPDFIIVLIRQFVSIIHRFPHNIVIIRKPGRRLCDKSAGGGRCIHFSMTKFDRRQPFPKTYEQKFQLQHAPLPRL